MARITDIFDRGKRKAIFVQRASGGEQKTSVRKLDEKKQISVRNQPSGRGIRFAMHEDAIKALNNAASGGYLTKREAKIGEKEIRLAFQKTQTAPELDEKIVNILKRYTKH